MKKLKRTKILISLIIVCFSCFILQMQAVSSSSNITANGKIFKNGINSVVKTQDQFDTFIEQLNFSYADEQYIIEFLWESNTYAIPGILVPAKMNNINNDHYVFAPFKTKFGNIEVVNIAYTLHANKHDLLPVNYDIMSNEPVLTIILTDNVDVYYWQAIVYINNSSQMAKNNLSESPLIVSNDENMFDLANEYYFLKGTESTEIRISSDEVMSFSEVDSMYFNKQYDLENVSSVSLYSNQNTDETNNNPYYDYGVPNFPFQTVNSSWSWRNVGQGSDGIVNPWRYYWNTYEKYGSNNLYTSIILIEIIKEDPETYIPKTINNVSYNLCSTMVQIKIMLTPHTVVYYPTDDVYELMPGGENLVKLNKPSLQLVKNSSGVEHFIYSKLNFSNGTKTNTSQTVVQSLASIAVKLLDNVTFGISSIVQELSSIYADTNYEIGTEDGVSLEYFYSKKIGSMKATLDGYLHRVSQYYGMRCELVASQSAGDEIFEYFWNILANIEYK